MSDWDVLIRNTRTVRPGADEPIAGDIAISDGLIAELGPDLDPDRAAEVVDAGGKLAFPGVVDAHQHWGIYNPLDVDTGSESRANAQGGVTTGITYIRTGQYYLNRGGPYGEFLPEVFRLTEGRAYTDYAFHIAPMERAHLDEIPAIITEHGVTSFKIFMFYGSHGLHGRSSDQSSFLMIPEDESYDYAHFEFVMRAIQRARESLPELADDVSLSLHCETAEIMRAYTKMVEEDGELKGLEAYSASRPPHSEGLAITIASYLAHETELPTINLLHLSSKKAIEAALLMRDTFPHVDFRREVTIGHLVATYETANLGGKVNPPLRSEEDRLRLWQAVADGDVDWVVSDHACCRDEMKFDADDRDDVWLAKSGFGGAEYLLPGLVTEAPNHGVGLGRIAELVAKNPAERFGLHTKGDLAPGYDADIVLVDDDAPMTVAAADSESTQEYTPFEGMTLTAQVTDVWLRGSQILQKGAVVGEPTGRYLARPTAR